MKKVIVLFIALFAICSNVGAQVWSKLSDSGKTHHPIHHPHFSPKPGNRTIAVTYDATSTVLTVKFPSNTNGGTVEVYLDGAKVAGITANSGTTFSCILREYGTGNYNVIVSIGNTVVDSKYYTVQ